MTHRMSVEKFPTVWRLTSGAWCMDLIRSAITDGFLHGGSAVLTIVTKDVTVSIESRLGPHVTTRVEVVSQVLTATSRKEALIITADMVSHETDAILAREDARTYSAPRNATRSSFSCSENPILKRWS